MSIVVYIVDLGAWMMLCKTLLWDFTTARALKIGSASGLTKGTEKEIVEEEGKLTNAGTSLPKISLENPRPLG